ncbi:hypothetical protein OE747_09490 [Ruegeria sp. XHP0148]|uniref:Uncharacterized protein n=2 Tax=Ruegeria aquimaris TaxID=2984333 RepID=A0ABT3AJV4_9RHOB|nr:hypothetical protein [Ruegeria sp. XHP0148]
MRLRPFDDHQSNRHPAFELRRQRRFCPGLGAARLFRSGVQNHLVAGRMDRPRPSGARAFPGFPLIGAIQFRGALVG